MEETLQPSIILWIKLPGSFVIDDAQLYQVGPARHAFLPFPPTDQYGVLVSQQFGDLLLLIARILADYF